jgi:hypothetical protein
VKECDSEEVVLASLETPQLVFFNCDKIT